MTTFTKSNLLPQDRGSVDVHSEQKRVADEERRGYEKLAPFASDPRYVQLSSTAVARCFSYLRTDPTNRLGMHINLRHLLSGGVTASIGDIEIDEGWLALAVRQVYESITAVGFVAFTFVPAPESKYGVQGCFIDLEQYTIYKYRNKLGEPDYIFETRADPISGFSRGSATDALGGKLVPNIFTITVDEPDSMGNLQSTIAALMHLEDEYVWFNGLAKTAAFGRAHPLVLTEFKEHKQQSLETQIDSLGRGQLLGQMEKSAQAFGRFSALQNYLSAAERSMGTTSYQNVISAMANMQRQQQSEIDRPVLDLDNDRKYVAAQLPEAPEEQHQRQLMLQQIKLMAQNVPPALVQVESSRSNRVGVDQNARGLFETAQLYAQTQMTDILKFVIKVMYAPTAAARMLSGVPLWEDTPSVSEVAKFTEPKVMIMGSPSPDVMRQLYLDGILKYSALRKHIAKQYSIPLSDLNAEPEFSLEELLTQGKLSLEKAKATTAKINADSKDRQMAHQEKQQKGTKRKTTASSGGGAKQPKAKKAKVS